MSRFLKECYQSLEPYVPGEQPRDRQYIKLNTNESPFPPSPGVLQAINAREAADLRLYSDPTARRLREKLAAAYGVEPENIHAANGSDDILNFAFLAYGQKGVAYPAISYGFYPVFAQLHGVEALELPLREDFTIDPAAYRGLDRLIVIANPNAPTGLALSLPQLEDIAAGNPDGVVVIDEAYVDFGGESALRLLPLYENLLIVRTFSKSRSMAGARLGFAIGSRALIADLEALRYSTNPYNLNRLTQLAGAAALEEEAYYRDNCRRIQTIREDTAKKLRALGFTLTDSLANFLFARADWIGGQALYQALKDRGILIRHFSRPDIQDFNRITVGSEAEMDALVEAIQALRKECL